MAIYFDFSKKNAKIFLLSAFLVELLFFGIYISNWWIESWTVGFLFNLDGEGTIPAWFSSVQILLIGILFLFSKDWPHRERIVSPKNLSFIGGWFIFVSMDEAAKFHETLNSGLRQIGWSSIFEGGHGIWIPIYLFIGILIFIVTFRTLMSALKVYPQQAIIIFSGALIFLVGAIGFEVISYEFLREIGNSNLYRIEVAFEELFEMAGASIILYGTLLCAISDHNQDEKTFPGSPPNPTQT